MRHVQMVAVVWTWLAVVSAAGTSSGGGFGGALHLESAQQLLLLRRRVVDDEHHLARLARFEATLHDWLLVGGHLPSLLHDDRVAALGVRGELHAVAHLPSKHTELPHDRGVLSSRNLNSFFGRRFDSELGHAIRSGEFSIILFVEAAELDRDLLRRDVSEEGLGGLGWAAKREFALGALCEERAHHLVCRKIPPWHIDEHLLGDEFRVVVLEQRERLASDGAVLAEHGWRVLEVGDLHHGADAAGREVELLPDAALEELDAPPEEALPLLVVAEGLLVEVLVLELAVDVVADGVALAVGAAVEDDVLQQIGRAHV